MTFDVSEDCVRLGLRAGAIVFRGLRVAAADGQLRAEIGRAVREVRTRFASPAAVRSNPAVAAFHDILRRVGANPRTDQPSIERLLLLALKRGDLPVINNLVDAYNLVSLRTLLSLGAHDLDRITPPVSLRLLTGKESFTPLGAVAPLPVTAGEYGYVDAEQRLLCRLDVLQADFSKVTAETTSALLIIEATAAHAPESVQQAFDETIARMTRSCGGTAEIVATCLGPRAV